MDTNKLVEVNIIVGVISLYTLGHFTHADDLSTTNERPNMAKTFNGRPNPEHAVSL